MEIQLALLVSLIPFAAIWLALFNPFLKPSKTAGAYIQALSAGFILGSLVLELSPKLLSYGLMPNTIIAFVVGVIIMLLIQGEDISCCSGDSNARSLTTYLLPFCAEFLVTAILIGIAATTTTSLIYIIAISFALCNFVCGSSIAARFTQVQMSTGRRFQFAVFLSAIFPVVAGLTVVFVSYLTDTLMSEILALSLSWLTYLVVFELLPEALSLPRRKAASVLFTGVTLVFILNYVLG